MKTLRTLTAATVLVAIAFGTGCAPRSFVRTAPGWKVIELRDELVTDYSTAWQKTVDTIARSWDIEILDKDSGYIRTAWVYGISGGNLVRYRGRITVKFPEIKLPQTADVRTSAEWWASGNAYAQRWVKGFDTSFQRDVFSELSGKLSRTVPAD